MTKETLRNDSSIEITGKNSLIKVSSKTENGGFDNEKKITKKFQSVILNT